MAAIRRRGKWLTAVACLGLVSLAAWTLWAGAEAPRTVEELLPADTVFYAAARGLNETQDAWKKTAAHEALENSGATALFQKLIAFGLEKIPDAQGSQLAKQALDQFTANGYALGIALGDEEPVRFPYAVLVLPQGGKLAAGLTAVLQEHAAEKLTLETRDVGGVEVTSFIVPDSPGVEVGWWSTGGHLVVAAGVGAVDRGLAVTGGKGNHLGTNAAWKSSRKAPEGVVVASSMWLDGIAIRKAYGSIEIPNPQGPPDRQTVTVGDVLKILGIDKLERWEAISGYRDRVIWAESHLISPAPRTGILAMIEQDPLKLKDLPPLPKGTAGALTVSLDAMQLVQEVRAIARGFSEIDPPGSVERNSAAIDEALEIAGLNLEPDVLQPLGHVWTLYNDPKQGLMGIGPVLMVSLDDAKKLRESFNTLLEEFEPLIGEQAAVERTTKHKREIVSLAIPNSPFRPAFCVDDKWLIVAAMSQSIDSALLRLDKKLPTWKPSEEEQAGLAGAPKEFTMLMIADPRPGLTSMLMAAPFYFNVMALQLPQMGYREKLPISVQDLPSAEAMTSPLFPNVSVGTIDKNGFHWTSRSSMSGLVPGLGGSGSMSSVGVTSVLIALLLPAVQQAREAARRTQSMNNLRQIALALHNYHAAHDQFPEGTYPNMKLKVEQRLSWQVALLPNLDLPRLEDEFDREKAWDAGKNADVAKTTLKVLLDPSTPPPKDAKYGVTNYVGWGGVGKDAPTKEEVDEKVGAFGYNRATSLRDITDGTTSTIMVSEARDQFGPWAQGGTATIRALTKQPYVNGPDGIGSYHAGGFSAVFADGSVRFISDKTDPAVLEAMATIAGGEDVGELEEK